MTSLLLLGRQPALGLAELESLFGAPALSRLSHDSVVLNKVLSREEFNRLGGTIKAADIIHTLDTTDPKRIEDFILHRMPALIPELPNKGKLQIGISVYAVPLSAQKVQAFGLSLKKILRTEDRSVRLIPNKEKALSTAQVIHNHMTAAHGCEIVLFAANGKTVVAKTRHEQNINSYTLRDRERPKRDTHVGMLPPKLAQIIINMATGPATNKKPIVLDPFCGTGVILQEALLMGLHAYGTDLEPRMITYTQANLAWLDQTFHTEVVNTHLEIADATTHTWNHPFDTVACETYLGQPITKMPDSATLQVIIRTCNIIVTKFLQNIHSQAPSGSRFCIAVPAWQVHPHEFKRLPLVTEVDQMEKIGYNHVRFELSEAKDLIYHRDDQIVCRELLTIIVK
jgi:tRNA G10  N-methylase Trm11